jgi:hypothetical protein
VHACVRLELRYVYLFMERVSFGVNRMMESVGLVGYLVSGLVCYTFMYVLHMYICDTLLCVVFALFFFRFSCAWFFVRGWVRLGWKVGAGVWCTERANEGLGVSMVRFFFFAG